MSFEFERKQYIDLYGPTTGDQIRLGDTELFAQVERDLIAEAAGYGNEVKFGGGKVIRDGMGQSPTATGREALDVVITNALLMDPGFGIIKADIGIRDGRIVGIGHAGNPGIQDGIGSVYPDPHTGAKDPMIIGASTEAIAGEGNIITAGGIDAHIHFICPQQIDEAVASGITTMLGGGTGPAAGTNATTCTPGAWNIQRMLEAADEYPVNLGFFGKGNCSTEQPLLEQVKAGVIGLKLHEDWGTHAGAIDTCLRVADHADVQVAIHTDTLNESGFVERTLEAIGGRTIHTFHSEGAGGGHAPDIIRVCEYPNILPSSTNPTRPYTVNTLDEHLDMLMVCHHLDARIPEDVAFAESRIRAQTIAAEDILHDMGAISMISSDSQAMGRVGEVISRTWQTAHKMKIQFGRQDASEHPAADNARILRYLAKYTINPAITHGISHEVGSLGIGKLADVVMWKPSMFGVKPEIVMKGGMISLANMGDPNASIPTPQPMYYRPQFAAHGRARLNTCLTFVSRVSMETGVAEGYGLGKRLSIAKGCRTIGKKDLLFNSATPAIEVDPETYIVKADGRVLSCEPLSVVPLAQRYFLF